MPSVASCRGRSCGCCSRHTLDRAPNRTLPERQSRPCWRHPWPRLFGSPVSSVPYPSWFSLLLPYGSSCFIVHEEGANGGAVASSSCAIKQKEPYGKSKENQEEYSKIGKEHV